MVLCTLPNSLEGNRVAGILTFALAGQRQTRSSSRVMKSASSTRAVTSARPPAKHAGQGGGGTLGRNVPPIWSMFSVSAVAWGGGELSAIGENFPDVTGVIIEV